MKIYYQIHKSANKEKGCANNNFTYPFFKKQPNNNGYRAYFNEHVEVFCMNDKKRKNVKNGIYLSNVPCKLFSLHEIQKYYNISIFKAKLKLIFGLFFNCC